MQGAAVVAGAGGLATSLVHPRQAGRQHGASRNELLQAAVEHPADLRRVARDTHRWAPGNSGKAPFLPAKARKSKSAKKKRAPGGAGRFKGSSTLDLRCRQGATNSLFLRAAS